MNPVEVNEARLTLMAKFGLTAATWDEKGVITSASRAATALAPRPPAQPGAMPTGSATRVAEAFAARLKKDHETRFAASHFKPKLDVPKAEDDVPRGVRAKSADGRPSQAKSRR